MVSIVKHLGVVIRTVQVNEWWTGRRLPAGVRDWSGYLTFIEKTLPSGDVGSVHMSTMLGFLIYQKSIWETDRPKNERSLPRAHLLSTKSINPSRSEDEVAQDLEATDSDLQQSSRDDLWVENMPVNLNWTAIQSGVSKAYLEMFGFRSIEGQVLEMRSQCKTCRQSSECR
ncbi:hypothetical protein PV11_09344 [Exophiala sideris]|uniref:Uncharacterized protein n=1 Tax=Exophiala sideris TaxID=1016849 RepID=A0A0D1Y9V2_9EURO|nr:hypothetical protein PV11_09344 [Exophiala sideris]